MNPFGVRRVTAYNFREFNAAQERARNEYARTPNAFAQDPLCIDCQERRRADGTRRCRSCRHKRRRGLS